ncbi:Uncharacterised protein [Enterococcus faecalis]|nr:Uncharacterised protein [Enterococcus faecalis]
MWFTKYERGASLNPAKITSGKKAYQVFGGSKIKGDSALANAIDTAKDGENKSEEKAKGDFVTARMEKWQIQKVIQKNQKKR